MIGNTGKAQSPWYGAVYAVSAFAVVSVVATVQNWRLDGWILAAVGCAAGGVVSAIDQARRNRRIDLAVAQARAAGNP